MILLFEDSKPCPIDKMFYSYPTTYSSILLWIKVDRIFFSFFIFKKKKLKTIKQWLHSNFENDFHQLQAGVGNYKEHSFSCS